MTTPENTPFQKRIKKWQWALMIFVVLAVIGQLTGGNSKQSSSTSTSTSASTGSTSVDIMTKKSCRDWHEVISEGAKGIQTDAELRTGMQKVYDVARYSEDLDIADAATRQLAAVTAGDTSAFETAATDFGNACKARGQ
jgi:hypothetical protein